MAPSKVDRVVRWSIRGLGRLVRLILRPVILLAGIVVFDLWLMRAERQSVTYPVDASIHTAMVHFAAHRIATGHSPWTSWFPSIALGSPQFLHYQGLAASVGGLIAQFTSPAAVVAWSTYLLLALWPICVYSSARLFRLSPWAAAGAAICSPFLSSAFESGYEPRAYIFLGYELWTQLFAMWCLPIAWGLTWRSMSVGSASTGSASTGSAQKTSRFFARLTWSSWRGFGVHFLAGLFVALTICLHFETGYLALLGLVVFPWVVPRQSLRRLGSAILIGACALIVSAWAWIPLLAQKKWSAINSVLAGTRYAKGYGARQMLGWLFTGQIFDKNTAFPVITILGGIGLIMSIVRWRRSPESRAIVCIAVASFLLECGVTTFGAIADILPGHQDLFFRRFAVGVQLAWLLLAGVGIAALLQGCAQLVRSPSRVGLRSRVLIRSARFALAIMVFCLFGAGLGAVISRVTSLYSENSQAIAYQSLADKTDGLLLNGLVSKMNAIGPGRVYAGTSINWGSDFRVGGVPVYKFLQTEDVDVMVYSPTTTSLMDVPQYYFDERLSGDYALFGIRYLILPAQMHPYVEARLIASADEYELWEVADTSFSGYVRVVDTVGTIDENRADLGLRSRKYVLSNMPALGQYLSVNFEGQKGAAPMSVASGSAGTVLSESDHLSSGAFDTRVHLNRRAVVALSVTFDPGWTVTVDGHRAKTEMLAPALLGVTVGPGTHTVRFVYMGYSGYPVLLGAAGVIIVGGLSLLVVMGVLSRRRERSRVS